jgi:hypothetical protein
MKDINLEIIQDRLEHLENILDLAQENVKWLKDANDYYKGFADKEDKKKVRYFQAEMTDESWKNFDDRDISGLWCMEEIKKLDIIRKLT